MPVHDLLDAPNRAYFRESREKIFGRKLEDVAGERDAKREAFTEALSPCARCSCRSRLSAGKAPLFTDYIVFGAFQWARVLTPYKLLDESDPVHGWFERCLDLHDGIARRIGAAAQ